MSAEKIYSMSDCMDFIKKKYPLIPRGIIRRVLFAEEVYMKKAGIIQYEPNLKDWRFKK